MFTNTILLQGNKCKAKHVNGTHALLITNNVIHQFVLITHFKLIKLDISVNFRLQNYRYMINCISIFYSADILLFIVL